MLGQMMSILILFNHVQSFLSILFVIPKCLKWWTVHHLSIIPVNPFCDSQVSKMMNSASPIIPINPFCDSQVSKMMNSASPIIPINPFCDSQVSKMMNSASPIIPINPFCDSQVSKMMNSASPIIPINPSKCLKSAQKRWCTAAPTEAKTRGCWGSNGSPSFRRKAVSKGL